MNIFSNAQYLILRIFEVSGTLLKYYQLNYDLYKFKISKIVLNSLTLTYPVADLPKFTKIKCKTNLIFVQINAIKTFHSKTFVYGSYVKPLIIIMHLPTQSIILLSGVHSELSFF